MERWFGPAFKEIHIRKSVSVFQPMSHEHRYFKADAASAKPHPVVSAVQEFKLEPPAIASNVQSRLIVRIVLTKLVIGHDKMFSFAEPVVMASAVQYHEPGIEIFMPRDIPSLADPQNRGDRTFNNGDDSIGFGEALRVPSI